VLKTLAFEDYLLSVSLLPVHVRVHLGDVIIPCYI